MAFAGGWIDQPFVSRLNPAPPGSMVVVALEPRASGSWTAAAWPPARGRWPLELWGGELPRRDPAELVRELYRAENGGKAEPSGSQDMIGLIYPGVSRLDYDFEYEGGYFPVHIESNCDPAVARWLERGDPLDPGEPAARRLQSAGREEPGPGVDPATGADAARIASMPSWRRTCAAWARR